MANIFRAKRGTLVRDSADTTPSIVRIEGLESGNLLMLTSVQIMRNQVTQYIKTLDNSIFGYAWGEGPGQIIVSGLIFFSPNCGNITGAGASIVNGFYNANNVYRKTSPVSVSIGSASFRGYLEGLQVAAEQNEFNYGTFSFKFSILNK